MCYSSPILNRLEIFAGLISVIRMTERPSHSEQSDIRVAIWIWLSFCQLTLPHFRNQIMKQKRSPDGNENGEDNRSLKEWWEMPDCNDSWWGVRFPYWDHVRKNPRQTCQRRSFSAPFVLSRKPDQTQLDQDWSELTLGRSQFWRGLTILILVRHFWDHLLLAWVVVRGNTQWTNT